MTEAAAALSKEYSFLLCENYRESQPESDVFGNEFLAHVIERSPLLGDTLWIILTNVDDTFLKLQLTPGSHIHYLQLVCRVMVLHNTFFHMKYFDIVPAANDFFGHPVRELCSQAFFQLLI